MTTFTDNKNGFAAHLKAWFEGLRSRIHDLLASSVNWIEHEINLNKGKVEGDLLDFLKQCAKDSVEAAARTPGDGEAKALAAFTAFSADIATKGIVLAQNTCKILLENAYADFKASMETVNELSH